MDWPKTPSGITDWEAVFEDANTGLIALVSLAASPAKLRAVTELIVEQLFLRDSDAKHRAAYRVDLQRLFGPDLPIDALQGRVADFLRGIKRQRIARAGPPRADDPSTKTPMADEERTTEEIFAAVFRNYVRARFDVATSGLDAALMATGKPPFILSAAFTDHFVDCLDRYFYPHLINANRGSLIRADTQAPDARFAYLDEQMNDHRSRAVFVEIWADVWKNMTQQRRLPRRPVEEKAGPLAKLFGKGAAKPVLYGMTAEDWDAADKANKRAKRVWAAIIEDTGAYLCPSDDDNRFLMNMLGRTPGGLQSQIAAITQFVVQGGSRQTFDAYQNSRDTDLALLVTSYRHPASMLGGEGFVARMLGDHPEAFRRERYPLVSRYLFDTMKAVPAEAAS